MFLTTNELKDIGMLLSERLKVDYLNFNDGFFRRRLDYMFEKMNFHRVQDLQNALCSLVSFDEITYRMSVPQTEMFRFPSFWRQLKKNIANKNGLRIWIPCLTSYHELYSLSVILDLAECSNWSIMANVVSDIITRKVKQNLMSRKNEQVDKQNFDRLESGHAPEDYFTTTPEGPAIRPNLIKNVTFVNGWFLNIPPNDKFDLVIMRDTLLCYNKELHIKALQCIADTLEGPNALLCIGPNERPLGIEERLVAENPEVGIYRLKN